METIKTPDFTRVIAEIRTRTCIEDVDAEVIEEILLRELNKYSRMVDEYYIEKYRSTISSARNSAYYDGHSDGYASGYDDGYSESQSVV